MANVYDYEMNLLAGWSAMHPIVKNTFAILAFLVMIGTVEKAQCQSQRPSEFFRNFVRNRPTVSPYLNLIGTDADQQRGGTIRPVYQTLVRPQLEQRRASQETQRNMIQMQQQLSELRQSYQQSQANTFGATGHPTRFMIYSQYFPGFLRVGRR